MKKLLLLAFTLIFMGTGFLMAQTGTVISLDENTGSFPVIDPDKVPPGTIERSGNGLYWRYEPVYSFGVGGSYLMFDGSDNTTGTGSVFSLGPVFSFQTTDPVSFFSRITLVTPYFGSMMSLDPKLHTDMGHDSRGADFQMGLKFTTIFMENLLLSLGFGYHGLFYTFSDLTYSDDLAVYFSSGVVGTADLKWKPADLVMLGVGLHGIFDFDNSTSTPQGFKHVLGGGFDFTASLLMR